jgi:hypothetical protein
MKYLKRFDEEAKEKSIEDWCVKLKLRDYKIEKSGIVNVNVHVDISYQKLEKIPIQFGTVNNSFFCYENKLISLNGSPKVIYGGFYCQYNKITSLIDGPIKVERDYYCNFNPFLLSLEGFPKDFYEIPNSHLYCMDTPIYNIYKLFPDHESYIESLDYNYLRENTIIKRRLEIALRVVDINLKIPKFIEGYILI